VKAQKTDHSATSATAIASPTASRPAGSGPMTRRRSIQPIIIMPTLVAPVTRLPHAASMHTYW